MERIFAEISRLKVDFWLHYHTASYMAKTPWQVNFKLTYDGTTIEISHSDATAAEALTAAWEKFERVFNRGVPEALALIEHLPQDDDIPF